MGSNPTEVKFSLTHDNTKGDLVYRQCCLLLAPKHAYVCIAHPYSARFRVISARKVARAHTQQRNFPRAKLDSETNVRFLLNEHGDLQFLLHNNSVHIILLN